MNEREKVISDLKVGIVAFLSIICLVTAVAFAGGDKGLLFKKTSQLTACLNDISGLKKGSTVTMGGMNIGKVTRIALLQGEADSFIEVTMDVRSDLLSLNKSDSKPTIKTQGMLGDRYIEISMGSAESPSLPEGKSLYGTTAVNFDDTVSQAKAALEQTTKVLEAINTQEGTAGHFIYDEKLYSKLLEVANQINEVLKDFKENPRRYVKMSIF